MTVFIWKTHESFQIPTARMEMMGKSLRVVVAIIMVLARTTPKISSARWDLLDCKFNDLAGPLHWMISNEEILTDEAAEQLGLILTNLLEKEPEFQEPEAGLSVSDSGKSLEEARLLKKIPEKEGEKERGDSRGES